MNREIGLALLRSQFPATTGLAIDRWESGASDAPLMLHAGGIVFQTEFKASSHAEPLASALPRLRDSLSSGATALLVVPHMGDSGRALCRNAGVNWLDLSGNAEITVPGLRIRILGEPNRHKRPGKPETLFAPKSARLARILLTHPNRDWTQAELGVETQLSQGFLSRLLPRYVNAGFLTLGTRPGVRSIRLSAAEMLLDSWGAEYRFDRHRIVRGHFAARSGTELLRSLTSRLSTEGIACYATGLAAAWLTAPFSAFRTVALYVDAIPDPEVLHRLEFHSGDRGSNTWLILPDDPGVRTDSILRDGIRCVAPVQAYVDLNHQSERSEEARHELRRYLIDTFTRESA
jgi:hypothetical protein